jgi:hypothetical protein
MITADQRLDIHELLARLAERCQARATKGAKERCIEETPAMRLRDEQYDRQRSEPWRQAYSVRSGVEGTMSS